MLFEAPAPFSVLDQVDLDPGEVAKGLSETENPLTRSRATEREKSSVPGR